MNDTDGNDARRERAQATVERHKGRAKEMIRGSQGEPESRSVEPARSRRQERGGSVAPDRGESAQRGRPAPQGNPPAQAPAHGLRRQRGERETPDQRQQMRRERLYRIKQERLNSRDSSKQERREGARDLQERPGIAERIRMFRSQPQQGQQSRV